MQSARRILGALFLLVAMVLSVGVLIFGLGGNAITQQLYLLGAIAFGVIAMVFELSGLAGLPEQTQSIYHQVLEIKQKVDKDQKKPL